MFKNTNTRRKDLRNQCCSTWKNIFEENIPEDLNDKQHIPDHILEKLKNIKQLRCQDILNMKIKPRNCKFSIIQMSSATKKQNQRAKENQFLEIESESKREVKDSETRFYEIIEQQQEDSSLGFLQESLKFF